MWLFLPGGLLMPASVPAEKADPVLTNNGQRTLQVRGRIESHLTNFIRDYVEPYGLDYSDIERTPQMDYNVRFYMTHEDFAVAMSHAIADIDYLKFKPMAEAKNEDGTPKYKDGRPYHNVLNSIWGTLTQLAPAGGKWMVNRLGNRSTPLWLNSPYRNSAGTWRDEYSRSERLDISGWEDEVAYYNHELPEDHFMWGNDIPSGNVATDLWGDVTFEDDYYATASYSQTESLYRSVVHLPQNQWKDYLLTDEYVDVVQFHKNLSRRERRRIKREERQNSY